MRINDNKPPSIANERKKRRRSFVEDFLLVLLTLAICFVLSAAYEARARRAAERAAALASELIDASSGGNVARVQALLDNGAD